MPYNYVDISKSVVGLLRGAKMASFRISIAARGFLKVNSDF